MNTTLSRLLAIALGGSGLVSVSPCSAQDLDSDLAKSLARERLLRSNASGQPGTRTKTRDATMDWGTGGLAVDLQRIKRGDKPEVAQNAGHSWDRSYAARAGFWHDVVPGLSGWVSGNVSRTRSGGADDLLLSQPTKAYSRSIAMGIVHREQTRVTLTAFDNGGWRQSGDMVDFANRLANGEARAKSGIAAEIGSIGHGHSPLDRSEGLTLRVEQATSRQLGTEHSVSLLARLRF